MAVTNQEESLVVNGQTELRDEHSSTKTDISAFPQRSSSILKPVPVIDSSLEQLQTLEAPGAEPNRRTTPTIIVHADNDASPEKVTNARAHLPRTSSLRRANGHTGASTGASPTTASNISSTNSNSLTLSTLIPTGSLLDLSADRVHFSNRGSLILLDSASQMPRARGTTTNEDVSLNGSPRRRNRNHHSTNATPLTNGAAANQSTNNESVPRAVLPATDNAARSSKVMSADEANLSRRVRAMYENGYDDPFIEPTLIEEDEDSPGLLAPTSLTDPRSRSRVGQSLSRSASRAQRKLPHETAGGIEDWQDVKGEEVDRYGFIMSTATDASGSRASAGPTDGASLQRVSTPLLKVSNSPRKRGLLRRMPSRASTIGTAHNDDDTPKRHMSRRSVKPQGSIYSYRSNRSIIGSQNSLRSPLASRDRKLMIDAADMLTFPPGLSEFGSHGPRDSAAIQHKEREREMKWRKMARLRQGARNGSGMQFDFDIKDPKLISRAWKGIPDRWRATAWYSFLDASAKRHRESATEAKLFDDFCNAQSQDSADDVQIDMDVPRTINKHIMFRRRYRGGQRLLFRVLHALSLQFPELGYVQGMATLAATLLCYYDEEHTFVMMVRLWQLRGLHRLYESGFEGLMDTLSEFEKEWLRQGEVAKKLEDLNIHCTAYGTRWYLTLFNYSIPFQAQLRVWDVFMLLGDQSSKPTNASGKSSGCYEADLDVLHATSAALMDATREIILDSDFENAMKVLTSWIPIKDEDLLMKVAHAEWKQRKRRIGRSIN